MDTQTPLLSPLSSFEKLPTEIRLLVLKSIPDVRSLTGCALSYRGLYLTVKEFESDIAAQVLMNEIGADVFFDASLVRECPAPLPQSDLDQNKPLSGSEVAVLETFLRDLPARLDRKLPSTPWTIRDALQASELHQIISDFTDSFIRSASGSLEVKLGETLELTPPTLTERTRFARAFYRYELFCNALAHFRRKWPSWQTEWRVIAAAERTMVKFAPWENAQLGCVCDYLYGEIRRVFDIVISHITRSGEKELFWNRNPESKDARVFTFLSRGLRDVQRLATVEGPESIKQKEAIIGEDIYRDGREGLAWALNVQLPQRPLDISTVLGGVFMSETGTSEDECARILKGLNLYDRIPYYLDEDGGPENAWRAAMESREPIRVDRRYEKGVYDNRDYPLRQWAYVMWDRSRLKALGEDSLGRRFTLD